MPSRGSMMVYRRTAFTLVELLVSLAVVAFLFAILVPSIVTIRRETRRATCLANIRSIGWAMTSYATTFGGAFQPVSAMQKPLTIHSLRPVIPNRSGPYWRVPLGRNIPASRQQPNLRVARRIINLGSLEAWRAVTTTFSAPPFMQIPRTSLRTSPDLSGRDGLAPASNAMMPWSSPLSKPASSSLMSGTPGMESTDMMI